MTTRRERSAIVLSGGIGDFLHYLVRIDWLLQSLPKRDIRIFVESTIPSAMKRFFSVAIPDVPVEFLPGQIHWTKTHPLLDVLSEKDRRNRPAIVYVEEIGFHNIVDWFLPFCCDAPVMNTRRLADLVAASSVPFQFCDEQSEYAVVSMRDKGFLWWPEEQVCLELEQKLKEHGYSTRYLGSEQEDRDWTNNFEQAADVLDAIRICAKAKLLVGTDTGFATLRHLLRMPNIYCINDYWWTDVMKKYGYANEEEIGRSRGFIARSSRELLDQVDIVLGDSAAFTSSPEEHLS